MPQRISNFSEIEIEFIDRVHTAVWCNAATVDTQNRPRSRVLHTIWEGKVGWVAVNRNSLKATHLDANPYISLAYIADPLKPVYAECHAEWVDDVLEKTRIWKLYNDTPPPLGYDLHMIWKGIDDPTYGLLRFDPWLVQLYDLIDQSQHRIWRSS